MPADLLSDALGELRLAATRYWRFALGARWGLRFPASPRGLDLRHAGVAGGHAGGHAGVHILLGGVAWLDFEDGAPPVALGPGDLLVLPHGTGHVLRSTRAPRAAEAVDRVVARAGGASCIVPVGVPGSAMSDAPGPTTANALGDMVCGRLQFAGPRTHPALAALPRALVVRGVAGRPAPWLASHVEAVAAEVCEPAAGAEAVVDRLSDVLLVQAVRAYAAGRVSDGEPRPSGWFRALADPHLAAALRGVHDAPAARWSVPALARAAGLSRTAFAARFREVVGCPPAAYVREWRVRHAAQVLRGGATVAAAAAAAGYASTASFAHAFRRVAGYAPGAARYSSDVG